MHKGVHITVNNLQIKIFLKSFYWVGEGDSKFLQIKSQGTF